MPTIQELRRAYIARLVREEAARRCALADDASLLAPPRDALIAKPDGSFVRLLDATRDELLQWLQLRGVSHASDEEVQPMTIEERVHHEFAPLQRDGPALISRQHLRALVDQLIATHTAEQIATAPEPWLRRRVVELVTAELQVDPDRRAALIENLLADDDDGGGGEKEEEDHV